MFMQLSDNISAPTMPHYIQRDLQLVLMNHPIYSSLTRPQQQTEIGWRLFYGRLTVTAMLHLNFCSNNNNNSNHNANYTSMKLIPLEAQMNHYRVYINICIPNCAQLTHNVTYPPVPFRIIN